MHIKVAAFISHTRNTLRIPEGALPMRRPYAYPARALPGAWFFVERLKKCALSVR